MKPILLFLLIFFISNKLCHAQYISNDDIKHFGAGLVISGSTYAIVYNTTKNKRKAFWYSLAAATLAGLAKETLDSNRFNTRLDTGEVFATALGGLTATITINLLVGNRKNKSAEFVPID